MDANRSQAAEQLRGIFKRCGYVRQKSHALYDELGYDLYKKGSEVRLVLVDEAEVMVVQALLRKVGLSPGKPFRKHARFVQPVYGVASVEWFLAGLGRRLLASGFSQDGHRFVRRSPKADESTS